MPASIAVSYRPLTDSSHLGLIMRFMNITKKVIITMSGRGACRRPDLRRRGITKRVTQLPVWVAANCDPAS
jgi:hypothetical protein